MLAAYILYNTRRYCKETKTTTTTTTDGNKENTKKNFPKLSTLKRETKTKPTLHLPSLYFLSFLCFQIQSFDASQSCLPKQNRYKIVEPSFLVIIKNFIPCL